MDIEETSRTIEQLVDIYKQDIDKLLDIVAQKVSKTDFYQQVDWRKTLTNIFEAHENNSGRISLGCTSIPASPEPEEGRSVFRYGQLKQRSGLMDDSNKNASQASADHDVVLASSPEPSTDPDEEISLFDIPETQPDPNYNENSASSDGFFQVHAADYNSCQLDSQTQSQLISPVHELPKEVACAVDNAINDGDAECDAEMSALQWNESTNTAGNNDRSTECGSITPDLDFPVPQATEGDHSRTPDLDFSMPQRADTVKSPVTPVFLSALSNNASTSNEAFVSAETTETINEDVAAAELTKTNSSGKGLDRSPAQIKAAINSQQETEIFVRNRNLNERSDRDEIFERATQIFVQSPVRVASPDAEKSDIKFEMEQTSENNVDLNATQVFVPPMKKTATTSIQSSTRSPIVNVNLTDEHDIYTKATQVFIPDLPDLNATQVFVPPVKKTATTSIQSSTRSPIVNINLTDEHDIYTKATQVFIPDLPARIARKANNVAAPMVTFPTSPYDKPTQVKEELGSKVDIDMEATQIFIPSPNEPSIAVERRINYDLDDDSNDPFNAPTQLFHIPSDKLPSADKSVSDKDKQIGGNGTALCHVARELSVNYSTTSNGISTSVYEEATQFLDVSKLHSTPDSDIIKPTKNKNRHRNRILQSSSSEEDENEEIIEITANTVSTNTANKAPSKMVEVNNLNANAIVTNNAGNHIIKEIGKTVPKIVLHKMGKNSSIFISPKRSPVNRKQQRRQSTPVNEVETPDYDFLKLADPQKIAKAEAVFKQMCKNAPKQRLLFQNSSDEDSSDDDSQTKATDTNATAAAMTTNSSPSKSKPVNRFLRNRLISIDTDPPVVVHRVSSRTNKGVHLKRNNVESNDVPAKKKSKQTEPTNFTSKQKKSLEPVAPTAKRDSTNKNIKFEGNSSNASSDSARTKNKASTSNKVPAKKKLKQEEATKPSSKTKNDSTDSSSATIGDSLSNLSSNSDSGNVRKRLHGKPRIMFTMIRPEPYEPIIKSLGRVLRSSSKK